MHIPPPPSTRAPIWRCRLFALAALPLLAGCAGGDFGEISPTFVRDDMHDWLSLDAIAGRPTLPSSFELTDDERQLRDLSYPLIEQPFNRQQWYSVAGEYGVIGADHRGAFDRSDYASHLMSSRVRSPLARYARLNDDIRNDVTRLPQFFETAARVLDIDQKRQKSSDGARKTGAACSGLSYCARTSGDHDAVVRGGRSRTVAQSIACTNRTLSRPFGADLGA